jgi:uncharacterized protein (DUF1330 family)
MNGNRTLWSIIAVLLLVMAGMLIYGMYQRQNMSVTIQRLELEKEKSDSVHASLKTKGTAAYIIFIKEKTINQSELNVYSKEASAGLVGHNITALASYGKNQVIEGAEVEGVAILRFPSFDEAKAWYANPVYQRAKEHRLKGGVYRAVIVDGIRE